MARKSKSMDDLGSSAQDYERGQALGRYQERLRLRRRKHVILGAVLSVAAAAVVALGAVWIYVNGINVRLRGNVDSDLDQTLTVAPPGDPFYLLLLGVDKDEGRAEGTEYGSSDNAYRSDSIMLARIDPKQKKVTLISIHRDTKVDLDDYGTQKINAAYAFGGASYATRVISDFAGVPISHYAQVDMDGLAAIVDQVGGITINLPIDVKDPNYTGLDLSAGEQTLDGQTAALLCRARHAYDAYGDGDRYRAANQRAVIMAVAKKVLASDPVTMASAVQTLAGYVTTDMDVQSIVTLALQFSGIDVDHDVMSGMEPTTSEYTNNTWYEIVDEEAWQAMMRRVDAGLSPYASEMDDIDAGVAASSGAGTAGSSRDDAAATGEEDDAADATAGATVLVLNASTTDGVAGAAAKGLLDAGFDATAGSAGVVASKTVVYYNGDGEAAAKAVAKELGITASVRENDGTYGTSTDVVVVLGADWD